MPKSLFSKLQVRLKRLPRLDGPESTDESEDQEELAANALLDGQIVDSAPSRGSATGERRQRAVRFSEGLQINPSAAKTPNPNTLSPRANCLSFRPGRAAASVPVSLLVAGSRFATETAVASTRAAAASDPTQPHLWGMERFYKQPEPQQQCCE